MSKKLSIAALVAALMTSGLFVGVSRGSGDTVAGPTVIELRSVGEPLGDVGFPLRNADDERGRIDLFKEQLLDAAGNEVGVYRANCILTKPVGWFCTGVASLRHGPDTERGTLVFDGIFRGFVGESLAVTGGTGAYSGARGEVTLSVDGDYFVRTVRLIA